MSARKGTGPEREGLAAVLRRAVAVVAVLLAGALDLRNRLVQVAHLRGVALLDVLDGLLEAADPALDGRDEFSGQGALPGVAALNDA